MDSESAPVTTYTTPEIVAETLDLPDPNSNYGYFEFSDMSHPSYNQVVRMIRANEDIIDRRTRGTWRVNYVKDRVMTIDEYWHDINGWRGEFWNQGGHFVQLRKNVLPWDPEQGDKLELRTRTNVWQDITTWPLATDPPEGFRPNTFRTPVWFDYVMGKMYINTRPYQVKANAIRISYRYGSEDEVPEGICRLCSLMTAMNVLNMQTFNIKVGMGGDIAGVKEGQMRAWQDECNQLFTSYQTPGSVRSVP